VGGGVSALDRVAPSLLVIDTPVAADATCWAAAARRRGIPVASIHDLGIAPVASDLALDGSIMARPIPGARRTLTGPRYAVVDPGILGARRSRSGAARVVIALGGGPRGRAAERIASAILRLQPEARIDIAAGFCSRVRAIDGAQVRWLGPKPSLVPHLRRADVAVVAGGVTLYEALALGIPSVAVAVVAAQRPSVVALAASGATLDSELVLGHRGALAAHAAHVASLVDSLLRGSRRREALARAGRALVDARGVHRVARELTRLAEGRTA
jgi:spore coat polysaccharide biosynthesis predicted glycosyltransferase SpsG